ncbi:hypothetical protein AV530_016572 [Patagioenas fasciata monilis]|uniref:Uncharacterized protein n=1 Tax=Patagioenas fasciata monilis TaxID=372326 RepID=A0A1V4J2Z2_PATFA|nr:hypothetical protein AV530_016572 [Patagioenas fasciata monilis]
MKRHERCLKQKETFGRNACHVLFHILMVSLGAVIITLVVALLWHFQKPKDRTDGDRPKLPGCKGVKVIKPPASVSEMCISLNVENTTHPESEHCSLPGQLCITLCNSDSVPSGSVEFWKYHEGDMSSQYALIKSKSALSEDQYGDSVCSSSH